MGRLGANPAGGGQDDARREPERTEKDAASSGDEPREDA